MYHYVIGHISVIVRVFVGYFSVTKLDLKYEL
nr:MAG TPA: hypothetical protein [Caudoviricetes sp.]